MKKLVNVRRGAVIDKMFPHHMNLFRLKTVYNDPSEDDDPMADEDPMIDEEQVIDEPIVSEWPCSVQKNIQKEKSAIGGYVIESGYVILCPYIDVEDLSGDLRLVVEFDGKQRTVENTNIEVIQNNYIYDLQGWKIGCKIVVKTFNT